MAKPVRDRRSPATVTALSIRPDRMRGSQVDQPDRDVTTLV
jgi:hypothetical protein